MLWTELHFHICHSSCDANGRAASGVPMCSGMAWTLCFSHIENVLVLEQVKVLSIADLLAHAMKVDIVFRTGNFQTL